MVFGYCLSTRWLEEETTMVAIKRPALTYSTSETRRELFDPKTRGLRGKRTYFYHPAKALPELMLLQR
jgi:hypothetical protein